MALATSLALATLTATGCGWLTQGTGLGAGEAEREFARLSLAPASNNCCWQALQQVQIQYRDKRWDARGVIARTAGETRLVMLDALGQRVFTATRDAKGLHTTLGEHVPDRLPVQAIFNLCLLSWLPAHELQQQLAAPWHLQYSPESRSMLYRDSALIRVLYSSDISSGTLDAIAYSPGAAPRNSTATLEYAAADLRLKTTTLSWEEFK